MALDITLLEPAQFSLPNGVRRGDSFGPITIGPITGLPGDLDDAEITVTFRANDRRRYGR